MTNVVGVIPARYGATRFPGKPLALIAGKPMVQWVYEQASKALPQVVVATDDQRIFSTVQNFGGKVVMTPASLSSGTERMAYVARKMTASYFVNVQGDEPMIHPATIRKTVALAIKMKAITTPVTDLLPEDFQNPNVVKVVVGQKGRALYFSRSMIPFERVKGTGLEPLKHMGLYVYPRKDLLRFVSLKATALEKTEMLEQLRALYYGLPIYVAQTQFDSVGVDTPADLLAVEARISQQACPPQSQFIGKRAFGRRGVLK